MQRCSTNPKSARSSEPAQEDETPPARGGDPERRSRRGRPSSGTTWAKMSERSRSSRGSRLPRRGPPAARPAARAPARPAPVAASHQRVREDERQRPKREVHLPGERNRGERDGGDQYRRRSHAQSEREKHPDPREQVPGATLHRPIRGEREHEAAGERRPDQARPTGARGTSSRRLEVAQQREGFHATTVPNSHFTGPKTRANGQPQSWRGSSTSGWKLYGSSHGAAPRPSWCPGSQSCHDLEMVAGSRRAGQARQPLGEEVRASVLQRRPRREEAGGEVDG